jgi:chromosomal replication initiation ATPase DnaA
MNLNEIARYFSPAVSHHTTVMHGINMVSGQNEMKFDNEIKTHLQKIAL